MKSGSQRIKTGFFRLALLGLVPCLAVATLVAAKEFRTPSGEISPAAIPRSLQDVRPLSIAPVIDYDAEAQCRKSFGVPWVINETQLVDGRTIETIVEMGWADESLPNLNAGIVEYERRSLTPINSYSCYAAPFVEFRCKDNCSPPFPVVEQSHLLRAWDFSTSTSIVVAGVVWSILVWSVGWLIRGFMNG